MKSEGNGLLRPRRKECTSHCLLTSRLTVVVGGECGEEVQQEVIGAEKERRDIRGRGRGRGRSRSLNEGERRKEEVENRSRVLVPRREGAMNGYVWRVLVPQAGLSTDTTHVSMLRNAVGARLGWV